MYLIMHITMNCVLCYHFVTYVSVQWRRINVFKSRRDVLDSSEFVEVLLYFIIIFLSLSSIKNTWRMC